MTGKCHCGHDRNLHENDMNKCSYELWDDGQWFEEACDCSHFSLPERNNGHLQPPAENHGTLTIDVWPVYMGLGESTDGVTLTEQAGHPDYQRGQIAWTTQPDGDIIGRARVWLPKGVYTHLLFCNGPLEMIVSLEQLEQPLVFDRPGCFDVDPIVNKDYIPRR